MCHKQLGPDTVYGRRKILVLHLRAALSGSILRSPSQSCCLGTLYPRDRNVQQPLSHQAQVTRSLAHEELHRGHYLSV